MSFLKNLDMNGVTFQPQLTPQIPEIKSIFGGILTLLIYGSSLAYLLFNIIQWKSGQNLPKIISTQTVITEYTLNFSESILELQSIPYGDLVDNIDPFDPKNLIFQVLTQKFVNGQPVTPFLNAEYDPTQMSFGLYTVQLNNMTLIIDEDSSVQIPGQYYGVIIQLCQQATLSKGFTCASEKITQKYFKQLGNKIQVTTKIRQFNTNSKQLEHIQKQYLFVIDNTYTIYGQIMYNLARTIVDDGFLFPDETTFDYVNNIEAISQVISFDKVYDYFQNPVYVQLSLRLFGIQSTHNVQYQKLNEVLADSGSIISIIMYFQFIAIFFNQKGLETFAIKKVIEIYYPQFSNIIVTKSLIGRIKRIQYKSKDIEIDKYIAYYKQLKQVAEQKLSIINQIHETSRLYLLFKMLNKEDLIKKVNSISIPLKILDEGSPPLNNDYTPNLNKSNMETIGQQLVESNELCLDDRDFSSISYLQAINLVEFDQVEVQNM